MGILPLPTAPGWAEGLHASAGSWHAAIHRLSSHAVLAPATAVLAPATAAAQSEAAAPSSGGTGAPACAADAMLQTGGCPSMQTCYCKASTARCADAWLTTGCPGVLPEGACRSCCPPAQAHQDASWHPHTPLSESPTTKIRDYYCQLLLQRNAAAVPSAVTALQMSASVGKVRVRANLLQTVTLDQSKLTRVSHRAWAASPLQSACTAVQTVRDTFCRCSP